MPARGHNTCKAADHHQNSKRLQHHIASDRDSRHFEVGDHLILEPAWWYSQSRPNAGHLLSEEAVNELIPAGLWNITAKRRYLRAAWYGGNTKFAIQRCLLPPGG